jgi:hypothetical protein
MTVLSVLLELVSVHTHLSSLDRVMRSLNSAVQESNEEIGKALQSGNHDYAIIVDDECGFVENLIGAALVTCQAEITSIAALVIKIHSEAQGGGITLTTTDGQKPSILAFGNPQVGSSGFSQIQVINAFANYFKHNDEWDQEWSQATGWQMHTVAVLSAVGAVEFSTNTLRACCDALNIQFDELHFLSQIVRTWGSSIHRAYESELKQLNLL